MPRFGFVVVMVAAVAGFAGCGGSKTELTDAGGVVTLGSQPLPAAQVTFIPAASGGSTAVAVTDENGRFKLMTGGKPGAELGEYIVTVEEGPTPDELRGENAQDEAARAQARLKNRPIPAKYATAVKSGLKVTVTKEKNEYKLELTR